MGLGTTVHELKQAGRRLLRAPGLTVIIVGTLGLGIGGVTAIFTVVNAVLLKPLPFEEPDQLIGILHEMPALGIDESLMSAAMYFTYRDENRVLEDIGAWDAEETSVTGLGEPQQLPRIRVTAGLLSLLRVQPVIGRRFSEEDDSPGASQTIMLSHAYWQRQCSGPIQRSSAGRFV